MRNGYLTLFLYPNMINLSLFQDLNLACPKDDLPLLDIDMLLDMTTGYEMYSLMDGFSGYNQIKIAPEDQDKTTFTCAWGTLC